MKLKYFVQGAVVGVALVSLAAGAVAADIPISHFFTHNTFREPKLSPSGRYLSIITMDAKHPKRNRLGIYDLKTNKIYRVFSVLLDHGYRQQLFWITHWVNDNRIIAEMGVRRTGFGQPYLSGKVYTINLKYKRMRLLQGPHPGSYAGYVVLNWLRDDPSHILTTSVFPPSTPRFQRDIERKPSAYRVSVKAKAGYHGGGAHFSRNPDPSLALDASIITSSPLPNGSLMADNSGVVRLASGWDPDTGKPAWLYRDSKKSKWKALPWEWLKELQAGPVAFTPNDKDLYLLDYVDKTSTLGLYRFDPRTLKKTLLFDTPKADIASLITGFDHKTVIGLTLMPGRPIIELLNQNTEAAQILRAFKSAFPDKYPSILSWSNNHSKVIVKVWSARDPGRYYLFNTSKNTSKSRVTQMFKVRPDIDPKKMAPMKPIVFKARDGTTIHGYLTLPLGRQPKDLPLIVHPHGGPFGVRDKWGFNPMVQFLASRGYAVLQINFRGSSGYGWKFEKAGFKHWGTTMQYDVIDGTRWVVKQGYADPERVCIFGASYGGYTALRSSELAPDLYQCTVGYDGVYDLPMMYEKGDIPDSAFGRYYLGKAIGHDHAELEKQSPVNHVKRLTGGLMLIEGGKDMRAPPAQVKELMKRLDAIGKSYQYFYKPNESHGFRLIKNQRELAGKLERFFDHWIGPQAGKEKVAATAH